VRLSHTVRSAARRHCTSLRGLAIVCLFALLALLLLCAAQLLPRISPLLSFAGDGSRSSSRSILSGQALANERWTAALNQIAQAWASAH